MKLQAINENVSVSRCRSCGAEIIWITTVAGRRMPCDAKPISYKVDMASNMTLITPDGKVARARFDPGSEKVGYRSHFATCPNANQHRRK